MAAVSIQLMPEIERAMDGVDGLVVVLRPPGELPVAAADGPRAKADGSEVKVRVAEGAKSRK